MKKYALLLLVVLAFSPSAWGYYRATPVIMPALYTRATLRPVVMSPTPSMGVMVNGCLTPNLHPSPTCCPTPNPCPTPCPVPNPCPTPCPIPNPCPTPCPIPGPCPTPCPIPGPCPTPCPIPGPCPTPNPWPGQDGFSVVITSSHVSTMGISWSH
jgi:hypothetical protein